MAYTMCSPLGVFLGFFLSSLIKDEHWSWCFYINAGAMLPCLIGLMATDTRWLNIEQVVAFRNECQRKVLRDLNFPEDYLTRNV